ncbi:hypothetical protein [Myroides sp. DF42-4-2]|uniref:hypothetical protein n=1 Tax=Myroides sp. DF42-4-2 TaxID=2746726 RepID=UPI002576241E|nr:hypothetical protein [Myroides sp. DF42-4-2]
MLVCNIKKLSCCQCFLAFLVVSCEIDSNESTSNLYKESQIGDPPITQYPGLRVFYDNGGDNFGCDGINGNCLPDIIITLPLQKNIINDIIKISNDNVAVAKYFRNKKDLLKDFIDQNIG